MEKMNRIELRTNTINSKDLSFMGVKEVVQVCALNGCSAVAITDHNSVRGFWDAEQIAKKLGIQLIYGLTLDCVDRNDRYQITVLARSQEGIENIYRLVTLLNEQRMEDPFIIWQQLEAHREGLLVGANFRGGQISRGILLRRDPVRLRELAQRYDYLEVMAEPYELTIQLYQLAQSLNIPVCGVQDARLGQRKSGVNQHLFRAAAMHQKTEECPEIWLAPEKLEDVFRELYTMPGEEKLIRHALYDGPTQILEQIEEELSSIPGWLKQWTHRRNRMADERLCKEVDAALERYFKDGIPAEAVERTRWELDWILKKKAAASVLFLADTCHLLRGAGQSFCLAGTWHASWLLALLGVTEMTWDDFVWEPHQLSKAALMWDKHWNTGFELRCSEGAFETMETKVAMCFFYQGLLTSVRKGRNVNKESVVDIWDKYLETLPQEARETLMDTDGMLCHLSACAGAYRTDGSVRAYYLLPERIPSDVILPMEPTDGANMVGLDLEHRTLEEYAASILLVESEIQTGLQTCQEIPEEDTEIDLNDPAIYAALPELFVRRYNARRVKLWKLLGVEDLDQLARLRGHFHSSGLWDEETEMRIKRRELDVNKLPAFREDIYQYLIDRGASEKEAADIMDAVTFGRVANQGFTPVQQAVLDRCEAEPWFRECCHKIQYLFPYVSCYMEAQNIACLLWYHNAYPEETEGVFERIAVALGE